MLRNYSNIFPKYLNYMLIGIIKFLKIKGNTIVPLKLFLSEKGWVKVDIACAVGKKMHDKREDLRLKDDKRDMDRAMKR